jgi:hypothetical protein
MGNFNPLQLRGADSLAANHSRWVEEVTSQVDFLLVADLAGAGVEVNA